jgi:hypothetical protein
MKLNFDINESVENERIVFNITSRTGVKGYVQSGELMAIPSGSRFTFLEDVDLPFAIIGKPIGFIGRDSVVAFINGYLDKIKKLVET